MIRPTQFLVNENGEKLAAVVGIKEDEELLEKLEDLDDLRAF